MMKLNETEGLDFIEQDILYLHGCPNYFKTVERLQLLAEITVDPNMREHICNLAKRLWQYCAPGNYEQLFYHIRLNLEKGMKGKQRMAKELLEWEKKEAA